MQPQKTSDSFTEKQLRSIFDNTVDGIVVINARGMVMSFNPACEKLFLYKAEEVVGQNVNVLMPNPYHSEHDQYLSNYMTTRHAKIIGIGREVVGKKKDGSLFPMRLSIGEVIEDGEHFFVGILHDITQQKENQIQIAKYTEALEKSNRELDEFVYLISHDLKEPVRGIYGYSQFLHEDYADKLDDDGKNKLQSLIKMSRRMDDLIDKLLYFSRLDRTEPTFVPVDLEKVISDVLVLMAPELEKDGNKVIVETPLPTIVCDQARVDEIFRNLIVNGLKYNDRPEKIIKVGYQVSEENGEKVFYVRDNGIGIPEKHFQSVFKMFKRLHGRDEYGGGTGSGLTIVRRIVQQHGGRIWIESELGEGTTFYFTLEKGSA